MAFNESIKFPEAKPATPDGGSFLISLAARVNKYFEKEKIELTLGNVIKFLQDENTPQPEVTAKLMYPQFEQVGDK